MIRKAQPSDRHAIAELIYIIWQDMELDMVEQIEKSRIIQALEDSISKVPYRAFYENVWVYEVDGNVAGCVIAYEGSKEMQLEENWNQLQLDEGIRSFGTPLPIKEAKDDEWYIETVATFPEYRGRGIATQLFEFLLNQYPEYKWSLNCDYANPQAEKLYRRIGFEHESDIDLYGHDYKHMVFKTTV